MQNRAVAISLQPVAENHHGAAGDDAVFRLMIAKAGVLLGHLVGSPQCVQLVAVNVRHKNIFAGFDHLDSGKAFDGVESPNDFLQRLCILLRVISLAAQLDGRHPFIQRGLLRKRAIFDQIERPVKALIRARGKGAKMIARIEISHNIRGI